MQHSIYGTYRRRLVLVVLLGAVLRLVALGTPALWRDEAFTSLAVHRPFGAMLRVVAHDSAPPLMYVLQHLVTTFWDGPGGLRLVSAIAGVAAIPLGAAFGKRLGTERYGLWCAVTVAVFPSLVLASRDARMYALAATLVLAATLAAWRLMERPTWLRALAYGVCMAAAFSTNYFTVLAAIAQLVVIAIVTRKSRQRVLMLALTAVGAAGLVLVPWLIYARSQFTHGSSPFWVAGVGLSTIGGVVGQFFSGSWVDAGVPHAGLYQLLQGIAVAVGVIGVIGCVARWRLMPDPARQLGRFLAMCGFGGIGLLLVASVWHPLVEARYASVLWGPLVCLIGFGFAQFSWKSVPRGAVVALGVIAAVVGLGATQPDTPTLATVLDRDVHVGDVVSATPAAYLLVEQYADARVRQRTHIVARDVAWYWGTAVFPAHAIWSHYPTSAAGTKIFYVDVPGQPTALPPPRTARPLGTRRCFSTICLIVYRVAGG